MNADIIYELLKEVRNDLKNIQSEVTELKICHGESKIVHQENKERLREIAEDIHNMQEENLLQSKDIAENKESLVEHMDNNKKLEQLIEIQKLRIDALEAPKKARQMMYDWLIKGAAGAGAVFGLIKAWDSFKGLF